MSSILTFCNFLSLLRVILTPVILVFFFWGGWWFLGSVVLFTLAALTDFGDGYFARKLGKVSLLGTFLDPIADKILVTVLLGTFAFVRMIPWWLVVLVILRDFSITIWRSCNLTSCSIIAPSCLAKIKTLAQMLFIYLLFVAFFVKIHCVWNLELIFVLNWLVLVATYCIAALTVYSGLDYFYCHFKRMKR